MTFKNRPCSKPWAIAQAFCSKSANFRPLRIDPKSTQTVAQAVENHFRTVFRCFREFGAISRSWQNRPCLKPRAIAQVFCSKSPNFRPLGIHPKSTQTVAQEVANHFRKVLQAFQRIWSDFEELTKSVMFKTMGYSPGLLLKIAQFSTITNSNYIDTNSRGSNRKSF